MPRPMLLEFELYFTLRFPSLRYVSTSNGYLWSWCQRNGCVCVCVCSVMVNNIYYLSGKHRLYVSISIEIVHLVTVKLNVIAKWTALGRRSWLSWKSSYTTITSSYPTCKIMANVLRLGMCVLVCRACILLAVYMYIYVCYGLFCKLDPIRKHHRCNFRYTTSCPRP